MIANFDCDVIRRSLPYLFFDGHGVHADADRLADVGGIIFGTLLAMMRLSGLQAARRARRRSTST